MLSDLTHLRDVSKMHVKDQKCGLNKSPLNKNQTFPKRLLKSVAPRSRAARAFKITRALRVSHVHLSIPPL